MTALLKRMSDALDGLSPDESIGYSDGAQWHDVATVEEIRKAAYPAASVGRGNEEKVLEALGLGIVTGRKQCIQSLQTVKRSGLPVPDIDTLIQMMGPIDE